MDVIYTGLYLNHEICFCLLFVFEDKMNAFTPYFVIYIYITYFYICRHQIVLKCYKFCITRFMLEMPNWNTGWPKKLAPLFCTP